MSNIPISSLPGANPLTGEEIVPVVQAGTTKRATTGAISALPFGSAAGSASGISFVTVSSATAALPSSRTLAAASPLALTDGGAGAAITIGLSGVLGVPFGGTGTTTIAANRVLIGDSVGTSISSVAAATTSGYVLSAVVGGPPQWEFKSGLGTVTSVGLSGGTTGLSVSNSPITISGTMTISGTLVVPNGGTGATTLAAHGLLLGNGTGAIAVTAVGTAGQLLVGQGAASDPLWKTPLGDLAMTAGGTATVGNSLGHALLNLPLTSGIIVATSASSATQRALAEGGGITITNADGSAGNPTIGLTQIAGLSVLGTSTSATGTPAAITGAADQFLKVSSGATTLAFASMPLVTAWTPQLRFGNSTAGITYGAQAQNGYVYSIGKLVIMQALLTLTSKGTATGNATIGNFPSIATASSNVGNTASAFLYTNNAGAITGSPFGLIVANGTTIILQQSNGTTASSLTDANFTNTTTVTITIPYLAA